MASASPTMSNTVSPAPSHANGNGTATEASTAASVNRKDRRMQWWQKMRKKGSANDKTEDESTPEDQRKKLRNRSAIAKPDSLKYEPDLNKGFHSKLVQSLFVNSPSKKKKKKGGQVESSPSKQKSPPAGSPKKTKPQSSQPEVFDSYKFSMKLINGEVDVNKDSPGGKESKDKYVLFIGNLPFDITREQLEDHFRKTGGIKSIRIPREKATDKGRGFAYMEFDGRISHGIALRLHQTTLGGRKINVEFTSIGGGKSEKRKQKLKQKNMKRKRMKMQ